LTWRELRAGKEYHWLKQAKAADTSVPDRIAALERAFEVEPTNFETAYAIGEAYRVQSWEGGVDYEQQAEKAMEWFDRAMKLNPYDGYAFMRYGMCLDWLGRANESEPYYDK